MLSSQMLARVATCDGYCALTVNIAHAGGLHSSDLLGAVRNI